MQPRNVNKKMSKEIKRANVCQDKKTRTSMDWATRCSLHIGFPARASHCVGQVLLFGIGIDMLVLQWG